MKIVGFPKKNYIKENLDKLNDEEKNEWALSDDRVLILEDLKDFQDNVLNSPITAFLTSYYWYFLND